LTYNWRKLYTGLLFYDKIHKKYELGKIGLFFRVRSIIPSFPRDIDIIRLLRYFKQISDFLIKNMMNRRKEYLLMKVDDIELINIFLTHIDNPNYADIFYKLLNRNMSAEKFDLFYNLTYGKNITELTDLQNYLRIGYNETYKIKVTYKSIILVPNSDKSELLQILKSDNLIKQDLTDYVTSKLKVLYPNLSEVHIELTNNITINYLDYTLIKNMLLSFIFSTIEKLLFPINDKYDRVTYGSSEEFKIAQTDIISKLSNFDTLFYDTLRIKLIHHISIDRFTSFYFVKKGNNLKLKFV
jgi:hypothetical protein